jgi:hypothetical protein
MTTLNDAIGLLESGDWETAHGIVQKDLSELGCWAHGIVHLMEGDLKNSSHWYGRAGRERPDPTQIPDEIAALKSEAL